MNKTRKRKNKKLIDVYKIFFKDSLSFAPEKV